MFLIRNTLLFMWEILVFLKSAVYATFTCIVNIQRKSHITGFMYISYHTTYYSPVCMRVYSYSTL